MKRKCQRKTVKGLLSPVSNGKIEENKYRHTVQDELFKLSFADSGTVNLLPRVSDQNEASLDLRRIFYWNCGQLAQNCPLDTVIKALESCFTNKRLDSLNNELSRGAAERLGVQAALCTTALSRAAAGLGYESHDCQNLINPFADYSKIICTQLAQHGHCYFKCKLSDNRSILMVAIMCEQKQAALIVIDPLNAEITPDSEAWAYIQFLKRYILTGTTMHSHNAPLGLENPLSVTCYANSALQCLLTLPHLMEHVSDRELFRPMTSCEDFQELIRLYYGARQAGIQKINPTPRLCSIAKLLFRDQQAQQVQPSQAQQSVDEFLEQLLGRMLFPDKGSRDVPFDTLSEEASRGLVAHFQVKTKEGYYLNDGCLAVAAEQPQAILSISMNGSERSLTDCLNAHFPEELLPEYNIYEDAEQRRGRRALTNVKKRTFITQAQEYIILSLERTGFDSKSAFKHENLITFPLTGLSLSPYMETPNLTTYRLKGVIMHRGSPKGGHYTALVLHGTQWYLCDDGQVSMQDKFVRDIAAGAQWESFTPVTFFYEREPASASAVGPSAASAAVPSAADAALTANGSTSSLASFTSTEGSTSVRFITRTPVASIITRASDPA